MRTLSFLVIASMVLCVQGWTEGFHAPPLELASPIPLPNLKKSLKKTEKMQHHCYLNPCHPDCNQDVSCHDYNPSSDKCARQNQVLLDWKCDQPCSCSPDGQVVCSISYRCVDMREEMEELVKFKKPASLDTESLEIPFSSYDKETPLGK